MTRALIEPQRKSRPGAGGREAISLINNGASSAGYTRLHTRRTADQRVGAIRGGAIRGGAIGVAGIAAIRTG